MKNIYTAYVDSILPAQKSNFYESWVYLMYEHSYEEIKDRIENAELLLLWEVCAPDFKEYIKPFFIWEIKNIWSCETRYNKNTEKLEINNFSIDRWNKNDGSEWYKTHIWNLIIDQEENFGNKWYTSPNSKKRFFIQIKKCNNFNHNLLYKKLMNHDIIIWFDDQWNAKNLQNYKRFLKMDFDIVYDTLSWSFFKNWKHIPFKSSLENTIKINKIINKLVENSGLYVNKDVLVNAIWMTEDIKKERKKLLDDIGRIKTYFIEKLQVSEEDFESKILLSEDNWWYQILWERMFSIE